MIGALDGKPGFTAIEADEFWEQGYLVVPGLADRRRVEAMRGVVDADLAADRGPMEREAEVGYPGAPSSVDAPGGNTPRRLLRAYDRDPLFREWVRDLEIVARVRRLLNTETLMFTQTHHNCVMTKHPDYSSDTGWHQDVRYWSFTEPALINTWLALSPERADNGALRVIPESHRWSLSGGRLDEDRFLREELEENRTLIGQAVQLEMAPGDTLFFHAALFHSASRNRSDATKYSAIFTYHDPLNEPRPGTRSASLPEIQI